MRSSHYRFAANIERVDASVQYLKDKLEKYPYMQLPFILAPADIYETVVKNPLKAFRIDDTLITARDRHYPKLGLVTFDRQWVIKIPLE
jgi:hypothetical protein